MAEFRTGEAIWKNKDVDQPINVIEDLGTGPDGKHYVKVEGSESGIPIDEIEYKPKVKTTPLGDLKATAVPIEVGMGGNAPPPHGRPVAAEAASNAEDAINASRHLHGNKAAEAIPKWAGKAGLILGGIVAAGAIVDYGLNRNNEARVHKQMNKVTQDRKKKNKTLGSFDKDAYYNLEQLDGLSQQLYGNRNGHTNSWGGNKY